MKKKNDILEFLNNKTLFYDKIDYEIIYKSWEILKEHIKLPYIIHIVGTNGKGSTGRYIASFLKQNNKTVLHYSSPHILKFNERIWINGKDSNEFELQNAHEKLQNILDTYLLEKLTYFEYTTLMAFILSSNLNYLVLEAGLGGEFDATNVVPNNITVVPSIGLDHIEFLGNTIIKIASTKLRSCDNKYILGLDMHDDVHIVKKDILKNKKELLIKKNIELPKNSHKLPRYLKNNLILALNVLISLKEDIKKLQLPLLQARCQKITQNITIDVGHNILAASVLLEEFINKKIILIYNSYEDKDYQSIIKKFKPILKEIQVIPCNDVRMCDKNKIYNICSKFNIKCTDFKYSNINTNMNYLVFGSFKVVEEFLKEKEIFEK